MLTQTELRRREAAYDAQLDCSPQEIEARRRQRFADRAWRESVRRIHRRMDLSPPSRAELDRRRRERDVLAYPNDWHTEQQMLRDAAQAEWESFAGACTQEQLDAWKVKFCQVAIPFNKELMPVTVLPFPAAPRKLIQSSAEFVAGFVAPEYLLDGILQRRFCYALTAQTGAGKTAIALRLSAHVALGRNIGEREVQQGRVLYFAAENYVDVQARWIAMAEHCRFDVNAIDVYFVPGVTRLSEIAERITQEAATIGDLALVVVDTSAATFEGDDENSNVHAIEHAKRMRSLTTLRGGPTVLVLTHPTKRASSADELLPRGGGAFLAEIDGNLCARKSDSAVEVHWAGKFRGMDFAPFAFRLDTVSAHGLKDMRGRNIPTVMASPLDEATRAALDVADRRSEDAVLCAVEKHPTASLSELAKALGWTMRDGRPYSVKVRRALERLAGDGLILKHRGAWTLTGKGEKELNRLDQSSTHRVTTVTPVVSPPAFPLSRNPAQ